MNYLRYTFVSILASLVLTACGDSESPDTSATRSDTTANESVFDPMVTTIDQARTVEGLSTDRTETLDKEIENAQ